MNSKRDDVIHGLRSLVIRGCTHSELVRYLHDILSPFSICEAAGILTDAFGDAHAAFLVIAKQKANSLDSSLINATILADIVANSHVWREAGERKDSWIDKIYIQPPNDLKHEIPFEISEESWNSLSVDDRSQLRIACNTYRTLAYRCSMLSVLSERLQQLLNEKPTESSCKNGPTSHG